MNKEKVIAFFILMMLGSIVIFTGLRIRENRVTVINVEGYEIEYHPTDRKLSEILDWIEFRDGNEPGSSLDGIRVKLGEPDAWIGLAIPKPAYFLEDNRVVVFYFSSPDVHLHLSRIALYRENGDIRVIDRDTEQREESPESIRQFFNTITDDMLNACEAENYWDAYWDDPLVYLNHFDENDKNVRLYGISAAEETAMLLTVEGEKVLIGHPFRNLWNYPPGLNVCDIDSDGMDEVIISLRTVCDTNRSRRYVLLVCDYEKKWNVYMYDDYVKDVEAIIKSSFKDGIFTFSDNDGNILWESEKIWDQATEYENTDFEIDMGFYTRESDVATTSYVVLDESILLFQDGSPDDGTILLDIRPCIGLTGYEYGWATPIRLVFYVTFADGDFEITGYAGYLYRVHK